MTLNIFNVTFVPEAVGAKFVELVYCKNSPQYTMVECN